MIELVITSALITVLAGVVVYTLRAVLLSWSSQETRAGADISLDWKMEAISRDLRKARAIQSSGDEIRFTRDQVNYYIYYLYNAADSYPPSFGQTSYQLKKAVLSGGIGETFTYGAGDLKMTGILPPPTSDLSLNSNLVTLDLSMKQRDETIRSRTKIRPRNL